MLDPGGPRVPQEAVEGKDHQQEGERPESLLQNHGKHNREQGAGAADIAGKTPTCYTHTRTQLQKIDGAGKNKET